jgi:ribonucleoside-diphosphate reductase alpha chain
MELEDLKKTGEAPDFLNLEGYTTLANGYLLPDETPKGMYQRLAASAAKYLNRQDLEERFFEIMWKGWLCPSTPVASNSGSNRALNISCFGSTFPDSTSGIFKSVHEIAMLSKNGGGCSSTFHKIRGRGEPIKGGGMSEGVVGWLKIVDQVINTVSQGGVRRGVIGTYLPIEHTDFDEFVSIRKQTGDESRKCRSVGFHHGVTITDGFMEKLSLGDKEARRRWESLMQTRFETGEPYVIWIDTANKNKPKALLNREITHSNVCTEIFLPDDDENTFVCCLSSLNLTKYEEWKNTDTVELAVYFLDAIISEFVDKSESLEGLQKARQFALKSRALGLGVLGWHQLLQSRGIPFDSFESMRLNNEVFKYVADEAKKASEKLAKEYGEPEWCEGLGVRNSTLTAIAPTLSNAIISGVFSEGIQPIVSNIFAQKTSKGTFIRKNPILVEVLEKYEKNTLEVWTQINSDKGSVKNLNFLSAEEKELFKTAREISQFALVKQAGQRQKYICQGQSLNLFFSTPNDISNQEEMNKLAKYIHEVHMEAYNVGVKSLYYFKSESALKGDSIYSDGNDCKACEG